MCASSRHIEGLEVVATVGTLKPRQRNAARSISPFKSILSASTPSLEALSLDQHLPTHCI